jgi:hypothetical protein
MERSKAMTYEVYVNGSAKFEGSREECEKFAAARLRDEPSAEIQITEVEED